MPATFSLSSHLHTLPDAVISFLLALKEENTSGRDRGQKREVVLRRTNTNRQTADRGGSSGVVKLVLL